MRPFLILLIGSWLGSVACHQELPLAPPPTAAFTVKGADTSNHLITVATYDPITVVNNSTNGDVYRWDLGNDSTTTLKQPPSLFYPTAGLYTLRLTTQTKDGQKSTTSKQVKVLNRVIKQVRIAGIFTDQIQSSAPTNHDFTNATVWAVIKLGANKATYPLVNHSFSAPILYQTPLIAKYDPTKAPYTFDVPGEPILDFAALEGPFFPQFKYKGIGYGLELYAQDSTGSYLLFTSYAPFIPLTQEGAVRWTADLTRNTFVVQYGSVQLLCDYE